MYRRWICQGVKYRANERLRYNTSTIPNGRQAHLYIMTYKESHFGCYKVVRAGDFADRVRALNYGHLANLMYVAQYPKLGHLELLVHDELAPHRLQCASREWFEVAVEHIDNVIRMIETSLIGG